MIKKNIILWGIFFLLFQINIFAEQSKQPSQTQDKNETFRVHYTSFPEIYEATGTVESLAEANISARITSKIMNIYVRSGDNVKKNELLIKLEDSALNATVRETDNRIDSITAKIHSAQNAIESAEAVFELTKTDMNRNRKLYSSNAVSQKTFEQSTSNYKKADAELRRTKQNVQSLIAEKKALEQTRELSKTLFEYSEITSPIDGVIGERKVDPGDLAIPGKILVKVFDPSRLMLEVPVRESLIKKIKLGDKIEFEVQALYKTYYGIIKEIVPYVDTKTRTFLVKIQINDSQGLVPGMYGVAKIQTGEQKKILVPKEAITRIGQTETVLLEEDNKIVKVFVRTIKSPVAGMQTVLSGLSSGDKILLK